MKFGRTRIFHLYLCICYSASGSFRPGSKAISKQVNHTLLALLLFSTVVRQHNDTRTTTNGYHERLLPWPQDIAPKSNLFIPIYRRRTTYSHHHYSCMPLLLDRLCAQSYHLYLQGTSLIAWPWTRRGVPHEPPSKPIILTSSQPPVRTTCLGSTYIPTYAPTFLAHSSANEVYILIRRVLVRWLPANIISTWQSFPIFHPWLTENLELTKIQEPGEQPPALVTR